MPEMKVAFPKPCDQKWDDMADRAYGRHCSACDTAIHDLNKLTFDEAERLLEAPGDICVRARIRPDGSVANAGAASQSKRKMTALVGATMSMTLTTAACQTPVIGSVSPRMEITGEAPGLAYSGRIELRSETGKVYKTSVDWYGKFKITNLKPGIYSLRAFGLCNEHEFTGIKISDSDVDMGQLELSEPDCIIIGVMTKTQDRRFS